MLKSILDALQHGRLVELPHNDKDDALLFLATMLEAVPGIPSGTDIVESVLAHEKTSNTSLGVGWACPHSRVNFDGELSCAIGWSPQGIDYGIPGEPLVRMIVMFYVPNNQRNTYLKEVSALARVLKNYPQNQIVESFADLNAVRNTMLDIAHLAMSGDARNYRARMIQLDTLTKAAVTTGGFKLEGMQVDALMIVSGPDIKPVILTQNQELSNLAGQDSELVAAISTGSSHELQGWQIVRRSTTTYIGDRVIHDCLAIKPALAREPNE
ncbi:MAG: PTS sugar transporter subunit IIA [Chlorobiaceae bacterium]|nr:PTS sugar transporter subunit IIA [Chlorobiaceae bacterium]